MASTTPINPEWSTLVSIRGAVDAPEAVLRGAVSFTSGGIGLLLEFPTTGEARRYRSALYNEIRRQAIRLGHNAYEGVIIRSWIAGGQLWIGRLA